MQTVSFKIGDAFPASEPVARFITVVAMMSNDWQRLMDQMAAIKDFHRDAEGLRMMSFRQQIALHHEAITFIEKAVRRFADVRAFVDGLDGEARAAFERVIGGVDPASPHFHGGWLAEHRNVTFHYPEMHPDKSAHGKEEITEALKKAATLAGTITLGSTRGDLRFGFADEVAVQWLPDADQPLVFDQLQQAVLALAAFAQHASHAYLSSHPAGTVSVEC